MISLANVKKFFRILRRERFFLVAFITISVIILCAAAAFVFENSQEESSIRSLWDGIWWAVVTICTVGYGDKYPISNGGKIVALGLMISGIGLLSLVTATIASVFVAQKIKEGKGLETVKQRNHIVICGWNRHTEDVISWLKSFGETETPTIVLVNELPVDEIDILKTKYENYDIMFIRGNHANEIVLQRANIQKARFVVLMADSSGTNTGNRTDERTILAALTIKSMAPKIRIVAELLDKDNQQYLKRANVDEIIIMEDYMGSLLASAVTHPGLPRVFSTILSKDDRNKLQRTAIPGQFVGKTFAELSDFFRGKKNAILIGLLREKKSVKLEDMLSDDTSVIETFIREKIRESKKDLLYEQDQTKVVVNPEGKEIITSHDFAVILSKVEN
ncbi:MAG: NAD-binding protein [Deltaproteobacteria bacterium]|nr:NAD-binding protein [Deltaproteobacteria bacterium]MBN2687041.1 NAD-binding protein [Deltaproteobacteria bacterium]